MERSLMLRKFKATTISVIIIFIIAVKRSVGGVWKSADDFKYDSELSQADSKSSPQEDDVYSGLDKQKLVQLVAKLLLERKDLARHVAGRVFDDSVQPAKRQRSLFAGDRGGWGGGYGK